MAHEPNAHATPVSVRGAFGLRPLRGPLGADVRQPDLGSPPLVKSIAGFGTTGAGAFVRNSGNGPDQSQGVVTIQVGLNPAAAGTITLTFPAGVSSGKYWYATDWAALTPQAPSGNDQTISWAASRPLLSFERLHLAYQWAVST